MQNGFSLLELLVVIVLMAILLGFSLPSYQRYVARAQVAEGLSLASALQTSIDEMYFSSGKMPQSLTSLGIERIPHGRYVEKIDISQGQLVITYGKQANSMLTERTLRMIPYADGEEIIWRCHKSELMIDGLNPIPGAQDMALSSDLPTELLPQTCRGS